MVLLALVDADYKFLRVDVGANGSASDAGVFLNSHFRTMLESSKVNLPDADGTPILYFFVGDDAFPIREWMQKPYQQRGLTNEQSIQLPTEQSKSCGGECVWITE